MFVAPGETLAGLGRSPAVALVLTATALCGGLRAYAVSRAVDLDHAVEAAITEVESVGARGEQVPASAARGMRQGLRLTRLFAPVLGALGGLVAPLAASAWFLLVFGILGVQGGYRTILATVAHAAWPAVSAGSVLTAVVAWLSFPVPVDRAETLLRTNAAAWVPGVDGSAAALLARLDLFLAWEVALTTLGFAAVLAVSRRRALLVTLSLWVLVTLLAVGAAAAGQWVRVGFSAGPS